MKKFYIRGKKSTLKKLTPHPGGRTGSNLKNLNKKTGNFIEGRLGGFATFNIYFFVFRPSI